ncbi:MAG: xanthine dehydrogenase family protein molybdopterin-binding subunit [Bacillota bacterium]
MPLLGSKNYDYLNKPVPRVDALDKVLGRAQYAADLKFPQMLYGGMLRSGLSHAKVAKIDVAKAKAMDGVFEVLTYGDLKKAKSWANYMYITDTVRYVGDVVAIVAAETPEIVQDALKAIQVEYQELPGVYTIEEALAKDAPLVHEGAPDNIFKESHFPVRKGDVEKGFAQCEVIIEREYHTQYIEHAYIEPEACVAVPDPIDGTMTVFSSSQNPYFTRRYVADILQCGMHKVRIVQQTLGGSFGGKEEGVGLIAGRAAILAQKTGRPVKIALTREESILESSKRHPFRLKYKIGATREGKIMALEAELVDNSGAYNNQTQFMNFRAAVHTAGVYEIPNVKVDVVGVFTNNIHSGAMRGYSSPQIIFAQEQLIEELAEELGMNPIEFRKLNALKTGSLTATSQELVEPVILEEMIDTLVQKTEYSKKREAYKNQSGPKKRGIGIATCFRGCGFGAESVDASGATVTALEDGTVIINSGLVENGQGLKTAYSQIAAEVLGVPVERIHFIGVDTHSIADCGMTVASRGTVMGSQAMKKAAGELKEILKKTAAEMLNTHVDKVDIKDGVYFEVPNPKNKVFFSDVCNKQLWSGRQMSVFAWYEPKNLNYDHHTGQGNAFPTYSFGCVVAEVEVDTETGYVDVLNVAAGHDVGTAVNPALIKGQIYGGIAMGMGFAITEEVEVNKGKVGTLNLDTYIIPTSMDMPQMSTLIFECDDKEGTYGAKSLGEPATEAVGAAIANAIYNATGRRIRQLPADLEKVLLGKSLRGGGK